MNRLELIERIDLAIMTYHANLQNKYSAIDIVDRRDAKTGDCLSNPEHLSIVLSKCCAYLNSDSFKQKAFDGSKPLDYKETLGWSIVKCLGYEAELVTSYMMTDALVKTFEYNPALRHIKLTQI